MVYRECTRHHWSAFRKIRQSGEVDPPLPNLHNLPLALVPVVLGRTLTLIGWPGLRALLGEMGRAPTVEAPVGRAWLKRWGSVRPRAIWLLSRIAGGSLLLRQPENQSSWWRGSRWLRSGSRHKEITRWWCSRGSGWRFPLFLGPVCQDAVLLGDG